MRQILLHSNHVNLFKRLRVCSFILYRFVSMKFIVLVKQKPQGKSQSTTENHAQYCYKVRLNYISRFT